MGFNQMSKKTIKLTILALDSTRPGPFRIAKANLALRRKDGYKNNLKNVFL